MPLLSPKFSLSFFLTILFCLLLSAYSEPGFTSLLRYRLLSIRCCLVFTPPRCGTHRCYGRRSLVSLTELKLWLWGSLFLRPHKPHRASASRVLWVSLVQISCRPFLLLRWNFLVLLLCYILLHCLSMEPLRVSEIHSSLSQWTSVIQVIEASRTKTTHSGRASKIYRRFVFSDSHGVKVSAVAFDDNVARIEGLLVPFKKYYIGGASVEEVPRPASPDLYRFFWIINRDTLIKEIFETGTPSLPPYFDLTPFTSFQHLADSRVSPPSLHSAYMMGVVLHALPVRESRFDLPSVVTRDYVVVDQRNMPILLTLTGDLVSEIGNAISDAIASIESKPVIIAIRVRVKTSDYLSLCTTATSVVLISPRVLEATHLEQWLYTPPFCNSEGDLFPLSLPMAGLAYHYCLLSVSIWMGETVGKV